MKNCNQINSLFSVHWISIQRNILPIAIFCFSVFVDKRSFVQENFFKPDDAPTEALALTLLSFFLIARIVDSHHLSDFKRSRISNFQKLIFSRHVWSDGWKLLFLIVDIKCEKRLPYLIIDEFHFEITVPRYNPYLYRARVNAKTHILSETSLFQQLFNRVIQGDSGAIFNPCYKGVLCVYSFDESPCSPDGGAAKRAVSIHPEES